MTQELKKIHYNKPQLKSLLIESYEEYCVWGRGTGKSEGRIAPRLKHNILSMPRSTGAMVGATYQQLLTRTLPPVILGLERLGLIKDQHYFIGRKPPAKWHWPEAYRPPLSHDYFISFFNGAGVHLVSQDRPGTSNGLSIDWIIGDEAKLLNKKKLDSELLPTNRGNGQFFGHVPQHHGMLFCTDMPTTPQAKWILDKEQDMNKEQINIILSLQKKLQPLLKLATEVKGDSLLQLQKEIIRIENLLNKMRVDSVYYSEFSSIENIAVLGEKYIRQMQRSLPDLEFQTSILGRRIFKVENGFYGMLNDDLHTYDSYNYSYLDSLGLDFNKLVDPDCRQDSELMPVPIDIALDYGGVHNFIVAGQEGMNTFKFLNAKFVKSKNKKFLPDLIKDFCKYYRYHHSKIVNYYYDHTAVGLYQGAQESVYTMVCAGFEAQGWEINPINIGVTPSPRSRFNLWQYAFATDNIEYPTPMFHKENCKFLLTSMHQAQVIEGKTGFEKDKRSERKDTVQQEESTHFSDAADTLYWGKFSERMRSSGDYFDTMFG